MKKGVLVFVCILAVLALAVALFFQIKDDLLPEAKDGNEEQEELSDVTIAPEQSINDIHLRDNQYLYDADDRSVVTMYLTVFYGNASDNTNHTWEEVNAYSAYYYDQHGIDRYRVAGLLQVGDENGPVEGEVGYGLHVPNAYVQIRGQTSSKNAQKNYKIKILDGFGEWRGQTTVALNKHMSEGLRFRNKFSFDILSEIPQIMSLRTQFVHLYVCDKTGDSPDEFVDYGLYTQVEQPNKTYLRAHGLDKNGYLYKVNNFAFNEMDEITTVDDSNYDRQAFETLIETKGREDHEKLVNLMKAVNDYSISNDELLEKYFDTENIAYWMAFNILLGNADTLNRNMYLYSPLNGDKWYILPWDFDGVLLDVDYSKKDFVDLVDWEKGVTNYWGNQLFKRALMTSKFRDELDLAVEEIYSEYLNDENVKSLLESYSKVTVDYLAKMPDIQYAPLTPEEFNEVMKEIPEQIKKNYDLYKKSLVSPMPGYVDVPEIKDGKLTIRWDGFYDFENANVTYDVILARDYEYKDVIFEEDNLLLSFVQKTIDLPAGQYFIHVSATNSLGNKTNCFDYYRNANGKVYGTYSFWVEKDGSISVYEDIEE